MQYDVISSGSKGNCTLIFSHGHCIQIDFGIAKKRVVSALESYGYSFSDVEAVLVTHDHSDHASHIASADKDKVYSGNPSLPKLQGVISGDKLLHPFQSIQISVFTITPLPLSHDAKNTLGFVISDGEEKLAYVTDTGFVPEKNFPYLNNLNYYLFESNHDPKMLYESKRPDYLIRRIISDMGHLSNLDCGYYLSSFVGPETKEIVLAHLSDECNTPDLALKTLNDVFLRQLGYIPEISVKAASEKNETKGGR